MSISLIDEFQRYREQTFVAVSRSMFLLVDRVDFFASKPAPTLELGQMWERACSRRQPHRHKISNRQKQKCQARCLAFFCNPSNTRWRIRMAVSYPVAIACQRSCCPFFPGCWLRSCARRR
ncbi:hypothetical protein C5612_00305 [Pseudomonas frederiksbergensis]|uniref:Uncharacterized protein n=1 Tax=Pseudomonas frederiksbergensis TaxID=104087 RepID=A0A2S8HUK9_9PSED|nr:hypothetical protein C5612_00305 [Pseudomonas frederiksbergensis]